MKVAFEVFQTADGLTLYGDKEGNYYVSNKQHLLSIVGALLIDMNSKWLSDRVLAGKLVQNLKEKGVHSLDGNEFYQVKGIL